MKERKLLSLSRTVIDDVKRLEIEEGFNFSGWVETMYRKHKLSEKSLLKKAKKHLLLYNKTRNRANYLSKKRLVCVYSLLNFHQVYLKTSAEIIQRKPEFLAKRHAIWNKNYPDKAVSIEKFNKLLQTFGVKNDEKIE